MRSTVQTVEWRDGAVVMIDQRLLPGRDFPLTDGDVIELGALRMTLRIVQSPGEPEGSNTHQHQTPNPNPLRKWYFGRSGQ